MTDVLKRWDGFTRLGFRCCCSESDLRGWYFLSLEVGLNYFVGITPREWNYLMWEGGINTGILYVSFFTSNRQRSQEGSSEEWSDIFILGAAVWDVG